MRPSIVTEVFREARDTLCNVKTISGLMRELKLGHVDLLKIDVEGNDFQATHLNGMWILNPNLSPIINLEVTS